MKTRLNPFVIITAVLFLLILISVESKVTQAWSVPLPENVPSQSVVFVGTNGTGVFRSTDGGNSWVPVNNGIGNLYVTALAVSPNYAQDQTVFAGTQSGWIFKTTNGGSTWSVAGSWSGTTSITSMAISPGFSTDRTVLVGTGAQGLFLSADGGQTWQATNSGPGEKIVLSPNFVTDHTAFLSSENGVLRSVDGGLTWIATSNNGLPNPQIRALAISPNFAIDHALFVGTMSGHVCKSTDGGTNWAVAGNWSPGPQVDFVAVSPNYAVDQTVFADHALLRRSTDGGSTWVTIGPTLPQAIGTVAFSPLYGQDSSVLASSTTWSGVGPAIYRSTDGGTSWNVVSSGLGVAFVQTIAAGVMTAPTTTPTPSPTPTLTPTPISTPVPLSVNLAGQIGGEVYAVTVQNNLAYIGVGPRLTILDVSDPSHPHVIGQTSVLAGVIQNITISGQYAYVAAGNGGLRIIDVSNPAIPIEVGSFEYSAPQHLINDVSVAGNYVYIVSDINGILSVLDITNPAVPREIANLWIAFGSGVSVVGNHAYVTEGQRLRIINVADPTHPTELSVTAMSGCTAISRPVVVGNLVYLTSGKGGLRIFNVNDPTHPNEIGSLAPPSELANGVAVRGNYAYVANDRGGLRVVDISNPAVPREISYYDTLGEAMNVVLVGNYAYVADGSGGLRIINISDPAHPNEIGAQSVLVAGFANRLAISGNLAYISSGFGGLRIVDISNPNVPTEISHLTLQGEATHLALAPGRAYVSWHTCNVFAYTCVGGLEIIDVSDPVHPSLTGSFAIPDGPAWGLAVAGNYVYVADGRAGLHTIDISDPAHPREVGFYQMQAWPQDLVVLGNYAYVTDLWGLRILNISDPTHPREVSFYNTGQTHSIAIAGNYAYVAAENGLHVVNIAIPSVLSEGILYSTAAPAYDVAVVGNLAYIALGNRIDFGTSAGNLGLQVVDLSNLAKPTLVGLYVTPGLARGVTVRGSYAYMADGYGGLIVLRTTTAPTLFLPLILR